MDFEKTLERLVLDLFEIKVVKFGNFKLKSGIDSPIYLDLRLVVSHPKIMNTVTDLLVYVLKNSDFTKLNHICGVPYTALPLSTLVSAKTGVSMLIRRKEAKDHGTRKIIEGEFEKGDECIIIEDVVSSGISIMETVEDLEKEGLKVSSAIVVLDREQGGIKNLQERGINVHVLTSIRKVLEILHVNKKISDETFKEVEQYISTNKISISGISSTANGSQKNRLQMTFSDRAKCATNKLAAQIFHIMDTKKSLLCVAADVAKVSDLLKLASQVGPHICILKTHFDALMDFSDECAVDLMKIAEKNNFLILEDRKFSDIGNTVCLQYNRIKHWADLVTSHSIGGEPTITALKSCVNINSKRGCFLVAELSCEGNLINKEYIQRTVQIAEKHSDFITGLVCQSPNLIKEPNMIQLTPGVKIQEGSDNLGQNYNDPEHVVLEKGADVIVVGRGIISSSDPEKMACVYKEKSWNAYLKRIS